MNLTIAELKEACKDPVKRQRAIAARNETERLLVCENSHQDHLVNRERAAFYEAHLDKLDAALAV